MRFILYIFLLFFTIFMNGQVVIKPFVSKDKVNLDENIKLTFVVQIRGVIETESPLYLPDFSKFHVIGSASNRNTIIIGDEVVDEKIYQWVLKPLKSGNIKVGAARINVNGKNFYTEPFDIEVADVEIVKNHERKYEQPYLNIEFDNKSTYQNEPLHGRVKVYASNINDLQKVKNVHLQEQPYLKIENISYQKSDIDVINPNLVCQTIANFIMLPTKNGVIKVKPALGKMSKNVKLQSKPVLLTVESLPVSNDDNYTNAVGEYFKSVIELGPKSQLKINQPFKVFLKFKGKGNLSNVQIPSIIKQDSLEVFPPKISRKVFMRDNQLMGDITAEYVIVPKKSGDISLTIEDFVYFNPSTREYLSMEKPILNVHIKDKEILLDTQATYQKVNEYTNNVLSTVDNPILDTKSLMIEEENKFSWKVIIVILPLLLLVLFFIFRLKKWQTKRENDKKNLKDVVPLGSVEETEREIKMKFDNTFIEEDLDYIRQLKDRGKYDTFFKELQIVEQKIVDRSSFATIDELIMLKKGQNGLEEYLKIKNKINIEKYNPVKNQEDIEDIYRSIWNLFSDIRV